MGDLSKNFSRDEFACNCGCGFDTVDIETLGLMQAIRDHFGRAVVITSGCRCPAWNKKQGGASQSLHMEARAADFKVAGVRPALVARWVWDTFPAASVGEYHTFTHVDTRTGKPWRKLL